MVSKFSNMICYYLIFFHQTRQTQCSKIFWYYINYFFTLYFNDFAIFHISIYETSSVINKKNQSNKQSNIDSLSNLQ